MSESEALFAAEAAAGLLADASPNVRIFGIYYY
jgi:hypothetical protein